METRTLGSTGPTVSALGLGLGAMGMSGVYGPSDRAESNATIPRGRRDHADRRRRLRETA